MLSWPFRNMHGFCLQRSWGPFRLEVCRVQGCLAGASPGLKPQQLQGGTAGQSTMEEPPGEPGKAGLGLMAQHKAMFWRAAYRVHGCWLVEPPQN